MRYDFASNRASLALKAADAEADASDLRIGFQPLSWSNAPLLTLPYFFVRGICRRAAFMWKAF